jgi:hypothetical protein
VYAPLLLVFGILATPVILVVVLIGGAGRVRLE